MKFQSYCYVPGGCLPFIIIKYFAHQEYIFDSPFKLSICTLAFRIRLERRPSSGVIAIRNARIQDFIVFLHESAIVMGNRDVLDGFMWYAYEALCCSGLLLRWPELKEEPM